MKSLHFVSYALVVVGALNWGLIGLFDFNLVNLVFGSMPAIENIVYILVGVSAVYSVYEHRQICAYCGKGKR